MDDFDPWEIRTAEQASAEIASRIEEIQRLHAETLIIADAFDLRVNVLLEVPESAAGGHNRAGEIYWNPSAKYC